MDRGATAIGLALLTMWLIGSHLDTNGDYIAAIKDSGCNSHKQLHIEQEHNLRIDNYNLNSLRGE